MRLNKKTCVWVGFEWHFKNECSRSISFFSTHYLCHHKDQDCASEGHLTFPKTKIKIHSYHITQLWLFCLNLPHWFICSPPPILGHIIFNQKLKWYHLSIQKHLLLTFFYFFICLSSVKEVSMPNDSEKPKYPQNLKVYLEM